jgi:hypothetical protein
MIIYEQPDAKGLELTLGLPRSVAKRWNSAEGTALLHS